ncbi:DUF6056 family protein [Paenibacillus elgii]
MLGCQRKIAFESFAFIARKICLLGAMSLISGAESLYLTFKGFTLSLTDAKNSIERLDYMIQLLRKLNINKFILFLLFLQLIYIYILNHLTPLWHDEFVYSFIAGTNDRISSVTDIVKSQYYLFNHWTGRNLVHFIIQFFLIFDKELFNIFNSIMFVILIVLVLIYTKKLRSLFAFLPILILFWFGVPEFSQTIIWLSGSVNYLWTTVCVLIFLLPYKYLIEDKYIINDNYKNWIFISIMGVFAGWSQENASIISLFFLIVCFLFLIIKKKTVPKWSIFGFVFFIFGFVMLISAPGNFVRASKSVFSLRQWLSNWLYNVKANLIEEKYVIIFLVVVVLYHIVLYIYKKKHDKKTVISNELLQSLIFLCSGLISFFAMIASPQFPPRASFCSSIFFLISFGILIDFKNKNFKNKFFMILLLPFLVLLTSSMLTTLNGYKLVKEETDKRFFIIKDQLSKGKLDVEVPELSNKGNRYILSPQEIFLNPNHPYNKDYAKYFNLNSIKIDNKSFYAVIKIEFDFPQTDLYQIYYDTGKGYNEKQSTTEYVDHLSEVYLGLPEGEIKKIRFDPSIKPGMHRIKSMTFIKNDMQLEVSSEKLYKNFLPLNHIDNVKLDGNVLEFRATGNDPNFELTGIENYMAATESLNTMSSVTIEINSPPIDVYQVFYDIGNGFNEKDSSWVYLDESIDEGKNAQLKFNIPNNTKKIRLDPGTHQRIIKIASITIQENNESVVLNSKDLLRKIKPINQISSYYEKDNFLFVQTSGNDPSLEIADYME